MRVACGCLPIWLAQTSGADEAVIALFLANQLRIKLRIRLYAGSLGVGCKVAQFRALPPWCRYVAGDVVRWGGTNKVDLCEQTHRCAV